MHQPPDTHRSDSSYTLHGDDIHDPYLWMEESNEDIDAWIDAQNEYADAYLTPIPIRNELRPRFESYARTTEYGTVVSRPSGYFQSIERPDDEQPILTYRESLEDERMVLIDPNEWSDDGALSMGWWSLSPEGDLIAYGVQEGGQEQFDIVVMELESDDEIDQLVELGRAGRPAWTPGGFFYVSTGSVEEGTQLEKAIYHHTTGTPQSDDSLIREVTEPSRWPGATTDRDGKHLLVVDSVDWERTELWYSPLEDRALEPLLIDTEYVFHPLIHEDTLYLRTNHGADTYRLLATSLPPQSTPLDPDELEEIIPAREGILESVTIAEGHLLARYQTDVISTVEVFDLDGASVGSVDLPGRGTVTGLAGNRDAVEAFLSYESFDHQPGVYRVDPTTGALSELDRVDIDPELEIVFEQRWFESADGTEVPMFVVHRADLDIDEPAPALLYGYGGYEVSQRPGYPRFGIEFLRAGGVYAQANLRGGGEFGKAWHQAARHDRKQRTFDDMIAAAETLFEDGYTSPERLAIRGGSNGGLTVGAVMTQRPELVRAVVCEVPLLDMLRFHRFLLGSSWTSEYGSPDDPAAYEWIRAYSPYHHVEERAYPAVLFKTAESDSRVHPVHAWKMTARMQALATNDRRIICKTNRDTGHGTGKPTWMVVEEALDVWGFLFDQLGMIE